MLSGCEQFDDLFGAGTGSAPPTVSELDAPSEESLALAAFYARVEAGHRTRGLLRIDGGGPDVPFDARRLANTFMTIAFAREFSDAGQVLVRQETESGLRRWEAPVRIEVMFGASVEDTRKADDLTSIRRFVTRLGRTTGHPVSFVERDGNFRVLILSENERKVAGPTLRRLIPGIRQQEINLIEDLDPASYCLVVAADPANNGVITRAVAVIRDELPFRLRLSCIHEELAQGMGLANDSATARPSIFNDDDEFGRLTTMDERMLSILYDRSLRPGMSAETARPIVRRLAEAQMGSNF